MQNGLNSRSGEPPITEKIILGVDPGTQIAGYGVIKVTGQRIELLQYGVLKLGKYSTYQLKLQKIFQRLTQLIDEFLPDEMAIEDPFYGKNAQSMLKLPRPGGSHGSRSQPKHSDCGILAQKRQKIGNGQR